jgi:hypothetical protein
MGLLYYFYRQCIQFFLEGHKIYLRLYIITMTSNEIEFVFKIYDIANSHVSETYVTDISKRMDQLSLTYKFQLISEDDDELRMIGGSDSTYPYQYFESTFDKLSGRFRGVVQAPSTTPKSVSNNNRKTLFDRLFSAFSNYGLGENKMDGAEQETGLLPKITPVDLEKAVAYETTKEGEPFVLPTTYTGVSIIHLTVYDNSSVNGYVGGIKQFDSWLARKEKDYVSVVI